MNKLLYVLSALLILSQTHYSQSLYTTRYDSLLWNDTGYVPVQSVVEKYNPQKSLLIPIVESIGLNLALGAFNHYVMKSEFADISWETVKHNHELGWTTDADALTTNMFAHPFHGSIYYNTARSSGYNYWTSLGVAAIGSWQWEFFMENEPPAYNDWIMTSFGGSMLGEMFYRFSNLILDESLSGSARLWNEIAAGIFNPGRLFNRLIYGRTGRVTNEKLYETRPFVGEIGLGANNVADGTSFENGSKNMMLSIDYNYGTIFQQRSFKPFDFFRFNANFNFGSADQPFIGQFRIYNVLYGKTKKVGEGNKFMWGLFGHYDYLENNVYQVGGVSFGPGIGYRTSHKKKSQFAGLLHVALMPMGAANSDYAPDYKVEFLDSARTYNMGPGAHAKTDLIFRFPAGAVSLHYSFWWVSTWVGAPGDEFIGMLQPRFRIHIWKKWFIGLEYLLYHRVGVYEDYDNVDMRNNEQRLFIGYAF